MTSGLQTATLSDQRSLQTRKPFGSCSLRMDQRLIANGLQRASPTNTHCKQPSRSPAIQEKGYWILNRRYTHRFIPEHPEINDRCKRSLNLETAGASMERHAVGGLMFQGLSPSHGVLAHGRVCKPFAHERWPICTECWPGRWRIRTKCWPSNSPVCKPVLYCSQAATPMAGTPGGVCLRGRACHHPLACRATKREYVSACCTHHPPTPRGTMIATATRTRPAPGPLRLSPEAWCVATPRVGVVCAHVQLPCVRALDVWSPVPVCIVPATHR